MQNYTKSQTRLAFVQYIFQNEFLNIDCSENPYLIVWRETTPHEIAHSPSLSAFISPTFVMFPSPTSIPP